MGQTAKEWFSEHGKARAAARQRTSHICMECGTVFEAVSQARYCSVTCRVKAHRKAKRDARPPGRPRTPTPAEAQP